MCFYTATAFLGLKNAKKVKPPSRVKILKTLHSRVNGKNTFCLKMKVVRKRVDLVLL